MPALDNAKREKFCEYIIAGETQAKAYELAYGLMTDSVDSCASELVRIQSVADRIMELRKSGLGDSAFLSLKEKRSFLRSVVRTAPGEIDETSPLCQSFKVRKDKYGETREYELPNKLKALELDAKLAGELNSGGAPSVRISMYGQVAEVVVEAVEIEAEVMRIEAVEHESVSVEQA